MLAGSVRREAAAGRLSMMHCNERRLARVASGVDKAMAPAKAAEARDDAMRQNTGAPLAIQAGMRIDGLRALAADLTHGSRIMPGIQGLLARLLDAALIGSGALLASQIRYQDAVVNPMNSAFIAFAIAFALAAFPVFGLYESWRGRSLPALVGKTALAWIVVQVCGLVLMFTLHRTDLVSRLWFVYWTAISGGALIVSRLVVHGVMRRMRHAGMNLRDVAIVGHGERGRELVRKVQTSPAGGFRVTAMFDPAAMERRDANGESEFERFVARVRGNKVREIWLALALSESQTIQHFVREFRNELVNIRFIPDMQSVALFDGGMTDLIGEPAINLIASPLPPHAMVKKDIFDRLFAAAALLALSPLLIAIAVAVKLSSRGPVFFRQYRKGADGHAFRIYKFRSMRVHAEQHGVVTQATRGDSRITRVGAFLRRTSLDELPQFINVLRGEMSVVGPRPHALEHDEFYQDVVTDYIHRYRIKPGITGWAQVNGYRGETDRIEKMEKRVEHDLYYLRNWSFALDMRIVMATVVKGLVNSNAY